jgi:class 3 adenylate cyclase
MPETKYARNGEASIAYQVFGQGPDLLAVPPGAQNIEVAWEDARLRRLMASIGSFSRCVQFDKRGTGMSDPSLEVASLDERVDDMRAVVDDAGLGPSFVMGVSEGGPMALVYAATYPDRVLGLVLVESAASFVARPEDHPWGFLPDPAWLARYRANWGTSESVTLEVMAPSLAEDKEFRRWWARYERQSASPAAYRRVGLMVREIDVRSFLPAVRVPTLVLHRTGDRFVPVEAARYLAGHVPGAHLVELEGDDHFTFAGDQDAWLDEVREFVTGSRRPVDRERMLATVLFTDLVDSTGQASRLGDRRWRELLDEHDLISQRLVAGHDGHLVKGTGDGILGWFDGPGRAVRCAVQLRDELGRVGLTCRAGLHSGEIERRADDIGGIAVHIAARVEAKAAPGEVLVSRTVKDLVVGSRIEFADRGVHQLKGVDDDWQLLAVTGIAG